MALSRHDLLRLLESLRSADGLELVREAAERLLQELIEAEATTKTGAEWGEHTGTRTTWRNGHREKTVTTQAGDLELAIPKLRAGSFFPSPLEHRRRIGQALHAVITEAYVHGVSPRSVDDLVKALGSDTGTSKSEVSRTCAEPDEQLDAFRTRFLRHLRERGLSGVRPVISDSHSGLVKAIRKVMLGAAWRRCRAHFARNVFAVIPKGSAEMAAATIRTVFAQPTADAVRSQLDTVADMLGRQFPKVTEMLLEAKEDLTAFADFPHQHWKKIRSTNPLERLNRQIKRRTDVVQVFPNPAAVLRPATAVLTELHDEWIAFPRRCLSNESMDALYPDDTIVLPAASDDRSPTPPEGADRARHRPQRLPITGSGSAGCS
ncbi:transposase [Streptomyces sp. NPDC093586]|uniref:transposase n=1 Tax=Streptomyces sp. NPDC093586 TaxID=3366042 RepID=UPI00382866A5